MKLIKKLKIKNDLGLHIRPATAVVKLLQPFKSTVSFIHKKTPANARSIMSLLMLTAKKNACITVEVEGPDAKKVMELLEQAFERRFGEYYE
ncbi:MAG: HPr family phosphocarrier protein [Chlamydiae bacterium CG10_big_fil_rev_8_21_14_0_10_35_9]|nr:MAG: HPr family phosphocarrier protein [Chlamydiae bacterium CG10_big_fil_rev_8_21_14_0_10_35_9]